MTEQYLETFLCAAERCETPYDMLKLACNWHREGKLGDWQLVYCLAWLFTDDRGMDWQDCPTSIRKLVEAVLSEYAP